MQLVDKDLTHNELKHNIKDSRSMHHIAVVLLHLTPKQY